MRELERQGAALGAAAGAAREAARAAAEEAEGARAELRRREALWRAQVRPSPLEPLSMLLAIGAIIAARRACRRARAGTLPRAARGPARPPRDNGSKGDARPPRAPQLPPLFSALP